MTKQGYHCLLVRNIAPGIGQYALAEITPSVVRDWDSKVTVNAGRDEAAKSYRLVRAILNTAVDDELIARNPCRIRGGGAEHAGERRMIDAELVFRLADAITPRLRALVIVAGFVRLRTGELLGLRRCDVDVENGRLTVLVQAQQVVGEGRIVTAPKSEAGQRTVSLPKVAVEALEKHFRQLRAARRVRRALHWPGGRADHEGAALQGVAGGPNGCERRGRPTDPRSSPPRGDVDRPDARHHDQGADGPHRPCPAESSADLPARDGTS